MTAEEFETISNTLSRYAEGTSFTFKAMLSAFGYSTVSNQYMIVKSKDLGFGEMSDQDIVDAVAGMIEIPTSIQQNVDTIDLPTLMAGFDGVTITWSSNNDAINAQTGAVTHSANNVNVTLTATVKKGTATKTVTFEVEVLKLDNATYEVLVSFDCEDALPGDQNGNSSSKASYNEGTVELGEPKATWRLKNALISHIENDRVVGAFGIRVKCNTDETKTGAVSIEKDGEYHVVELDAAVSGKDVTTIKIRIDYSTDGGNTWVKGNSEQGLDTTITTYRFYLPEGNKRISIVAVAGSGNRCNLDNIKLMK